MAFNLNSITKGSVVKAPRILLLGVEKIGKSTFAAGSNNPIFIPVRQEEGIDALDVAKFPTVNTYDDIMQAFTTLYRDDHNFQTVVIDSASALEPVIWEAVCKEFQTDSIEKVMKGYGKGYTQALLKWNEITQALDALRDAKNMASIIIGHVKVKNFDDPERDSYSQYVFDINDRVSNALYRWADFIGFANVKVHVKEEDKGFGQTKKRAVDSGQGKHYLFTKKTPAHPGGGRYPFGEIPAELPLEWDAFQDAVSEVMSK